VRETGVQYQISAELPGVEKDDVSVILDRGVLTIEATMNTEDKQESEGRVIRCERRYGKYLRSFDLGPQVQEKDVRAEFKNGVLDLTVPKVPVEQVKAKQVLIN